MITVDGASEYFAAHVKAEVWTNTSDSARTAALGHARRLLARALGRAMDDTETAYEEGDTVRDEYAVYEQALYMIENGIIANGEGSSPQAVLAAEDGDPDQPRKADRSPYAPEALRWLGYRGAVVVQG